MTPRINDALDLIERANEVIKNSQEVAYNDLLAKLINEFKLKLSAEFSLPIEYFTPKNIEEKDTLEVLESVPQNYELTDELTRFYDVIETSM